MLLSPYRFTTLVVIATIALSGCGKQMPLSDHNIAIGPYQHLSGRLIVIEPKRRWQVAIKWHANSPDRGNLRLLHAATGTVVEFRWIGEKMQLRDSSSKLWKSVTHEKLAGHGIVIPPQQLALILLGKIPAHFKEQKPSVWESREHGHPIRLKWYDNTKRLVMSDIKHGRQATLIIQP